MHTIKFKIDEEKDLYNPFDVDDILLSEDVKNYISGQLTSRKIGDHVEISIISQKPIDKEKVEKAFYQWIADEEMDIKRRLLA